MAVFKCKMCGGDLKVKEGSTICECSYCGSMQTVYDMAETAARTAGQTVDAYLKRIAMFLEDKNWKSAKEYCEKVLDLDPENGRAYAARLLAHKKVRKIEELSSNPDTLTENKDYQKAVKFGDADLKMQLEHVNQVIWERVCAEIIAEINAEKEKEAKIACREKKIRELMKILEERTKTKGFGRYPGKKGGMPEPMEWEFLSAEKDKCLIISKYGIDCKPYSVGRNAVTWENSTLRRWLNSTFLKNAFTKEERKMILESHIENQGCKDTADRVFLLSVSEAEEYFIDDSERWCAPTEYVKSLGAVENNGKCWWWLRSPGDRIDKASFVCSSGIIAAEGMFANYSKIAVRPALWIRLET